MRASRVGALVIGLVGACGGSDQGSDVGIDAGSDVGLDTGVDAGCTGTLLTVKNYLAWCSVSVAGMTPSSLAEQTVCVPNGDTAIVQTPLNGFELGLWHGTDGDPGTGETGTVSGGMSTAHETTTGGTDCVWVCCPFVGGAGCTNVNQCP